MSLASMNPKTYDERIPVGAALGAVVASALLRAPWLLLILIMPHTALGAVVFYLVFASAGIVLLQWCLTWSNWTISLSAAFLARAAPGLVAASLAGLEGFHASLRAAIGLGVFELVFATFVVGFAATRPYGWAERGTGFDPGQLLPSVEFEDDWDVVRDTVGDSGLVSMESIVRSARDSRSVRRRSS
jgi:hypothetical protein